MGGLIIDIAHFIIWRCIRSLRAGCSAFKQSFNVVIIRTKVILKQLQEKPYGKRNQKNAVLFWSVRAKRKFGAFDEWDEIGKRRVRRKDGNIRHLWESE